MSGSSFVSIATGSIDPIYRQIYDQVRRKVAAGELLPGQEIPSVRDLAGSLAVHPMTISKAYSALEKDGVLQRRRGRPMVIAGDQAQPGGKRLELLRPSLERVAEESLQLRLRTRQTVQFFATVLGERAQRLGAGSSTP
jgi:GntR family transcriptional regulator